jgi:hypothetical protein
MTWILTSDPKGELINVENGGRIYKEGCTIYFKHPTRNDVVTLFDDKTGKDDSKWGPLASALTEGAPVGVGWAHQDLNRR